LCCTIAAHSEGIKHRYSPFFLFQMLFTYGPKVPGDCTVHGSASQSQREVSVSPFSSKGFVLPYITFTLLCAWTLSIV
jgi:hypothetical protein